MIYKSIYFTDTELVGEIERLALAEQRSFSNMVAILLKKGIDRTRAE